MSVHISPEISVQFFLVSLMALHLRLVDQNPFQPFREWQFVRFVIVLSLFLHSGQMACQFCNSLFKGLIIAVS